MNDRRITLRLKARTALRIGAGPGDAVTDAFIRQDASGRPCIPGTSLAGALRTTATRLAPRLGLQPCRALAMGHGSKDAATRRDKPCGCPVCRLFGDLGAEDEAARGRAPVRTGAQSPKASRLWIYDAKLVGSEPEPAFAPAIRDGVGIERASAAAYRRGQAKFDFEVLPAETEFDLRLELEAERNDTEAQLQEALLAAVLAEWTEGRGVVGGGASRGLGSLESTSAATLEFRRFDFTDPQQLVAYLSRDDPWDKAAPDDGWLERRLGEFFPSLGQKSAPAPGSTGTWVVFETRLQALGPLLVGSPVASGESGFDHAPLQEGDPARPILPGSSLKGVLRSQAEKIARTLKTAEICRRVVGSERAAAFLLECPACDPLVQDAGQPLASCDALLSQQTPSGQAVLDVADEADDKHLCLSCRLFGSPRGGSRLRLEDASLVGEPHYKPLDFLAIDRFTGGGAEQLKFDAAVLWKPQFAVRLILEEPRSWELGWLLLALRDIHDGLACLGFGAAKGFGQVQANGWRATFGFLSEPDAARLGLPFPADGQRSGLYRTLEIECESAPETTAAARGWIDAFLRVLTDGSDEFPAVRRDEKRSLGNLPAPASDTYFGTIVESLYPLEPPEVRHA